LKKHEIFVFVHSNNNFHERIFSNVSGRELLTVPATQNKMTIDMSSHENGLYFLHIETGSASETIKIIKQ